MANKKRISRLVVHCSASPDHLDIGADEIKAWHVHDNGWRDIGYHAVVRRSGLIELGRYEDGDPFLEPVEMGAHVKGHNGDSLAICWVGTQKIEKAQMASLLRWLTMQCRRHGLTENDVYGHRELAPLAGKTCPNIDMNEIRRELGPRVRMS